LIVLRNRSRLLDTARPTVKGERTGLEPDALDRRLRDGEARVRDAFSLMPKIRNRQTAVAWRLTSHPSSMCKKEGGGRLISSHLKRREGGTVPT
jgi:hypothetical protein